MLFICNGLAKIPSRIYLLKSSTRYTTFYNIFLRFHPQWALFALKLILELNSRCAIFISDHDKRLTKGFCPAAMPLFYFQKYSNFPRNPSINAISVANFRRRAEYLFRLGISNFSSLTFFFKCSTRQWKSPSPVTIPALS